MLVNFSDNEPKVALPESVSDVQVNEVTVNAPDEIADVGMPVKLVPVSVGAVLLLTNVVVTNALSGIVPDEIDAPDNTGALLNVLIPAMV